MGRLTRPAPAPSGEIDWYFRNRKDSPCCMWLPNTAQPKVASCGHDLSLDHALMDDGSCRACWNERIIQRNRGAA